MKKTTCAKCEEKTYSTGGYCFKHYQEYHRAVTVKRRVAAGKSPEYTPRRKHGCTNAPWFKSYEGMIRRSSGKHPSPCYAGITVCEEWRNDPRAFGEWAEKNGYQPGLTIDRKDSTKGYEPSNCRWLTLSENVRRSHESHPVFFGIGNRIAGRSK